MGRLEKQLDPHTGPLAQLALDLRDLRRRAGAPTYREMSKAAGYSPSALSAAASGANLPSAQVLAAYVRACGGDAEEWLLRRAEIACLTTASIRTPAPAAAPSAVSEPEPEPEPTRHRDIRRRQRLARRAAGLLAAALVGSMATVVPMAVWGAPSCITTDHGRPAPAANCHPLTAR
ncbi:MAG: helix-turn-helix domain-containing protein [Catenulispora sp.]